MKSPFRPFWQYVLIALAVAAVPASLIFAYHAYGVRLAHAYACGHVAGLRVLDKEMPPERYYCVHQRVNAANYGFNPG